MRHNLKKTANLLLIVSLSAAAVGCTTLFKSSTSGDADDIVGDFKKSKSTSSSSSNAVMVFQAGESRPAFSPKDRKYWVNLRNNSKPSAKKLFATLATGDFETAEADARNFLSKNPKDESALSVLALSLAMQKKYQLALFYTNLISTYNPESQNLNNIRGLAMVMSTRGSMADYQGAARYFSEAFQSSSTEIAAGFNLGNLYLELGNAKAAADTFNELKGRCDKCSESYVGAGIAYSRLRDFNSAKDNFEFVISKNPNHGQALYRLALIAQQNGNDKAKASEYLQRLLAKSNDIEIRQRAQSLLRRVESDTPNNENMDVPVIAEEKTEEEPKKSEKSKSLEKDGQAELETATFEFDQQ
jgi:tetratricopeptide (TPR) repeat protein